MRQFNCWRKNDLSFDLGRREVLCAQDQEGQLKRRADGKLMRSAFLRPWQRQGHILKLDGNELKRWNNTWWLSVMSSICLSNDYIVLFLFFFCDVFQSFLNEKDERQIFNFILFPVSVCNCLTSFFFFLSFFCLSRCCSRHVEMRVGFFQGPSTLAILAFILPSQGCSSSDLAMMTGLSSFMPFCHHYLNTEWGANKDKMVMRWKTYDSYRKRKLVHLFGLKNTSGIWWPRALVMQFCSYHFVGQGTFRRKQNNWFTSVWPRPTTKGRFGKSILTHFSFRTSRTHIRCDDQGPQWCHFATITSSTKRCPSSAK